VRGVGVQWVRTVGDTYDVNTMQAVLNEALTTDFKAQGGDRAKRVHAQQAAPDQAQVAAAVQRGERVVKQKFGVDAAVCSGDMPACGCRAARR